MHFTADLTLMCHPSSTPEMLKGVRVVASVISQFQFLKLDLYIFYHLYYGMGYTSNLFQLLFLPRIELGEQTVKNVDNLLGSGVTHVQLPVLPVWY